MLETKRFYILLALSKEPMHAFAIREQALSDSHAALILSLTSLRRILNELLRRKFITELEARPFAQREVPIYDISPAGQRMLKYASVTLADATALARRRLP